MPINRRDMLKLGATAGAALTLRPDLLAAVRTQEQLRKAIPSSGEEIPAVGLGTASSFLQAAGSNAERESLKEVVRLFTELGGAVIDTAPTYGESEQVLGGIVREVGNADAIFMATKISGVRGRAQGLAQFEQSVARLAPPVIDLNQVHNLGDWETQLGLLRELKQDGRIRYLGITTSRDPQYDALADIMRREEMDFVQFDYAIDNRNAERELIPIARDRGMATLINGPFGRTRLFRRVGDLAVPDWAHAFGAHSWAHFFLKWLLGSPAVTVVIPATSDPGHLRDNMGAGLGRIPNTEELRRMEAFIDALPGG